jgi:hypothetical protein
MKKIELSLIVGFILLLACAPQAELKDQVELSDCAKTSRTRPARTFSSHMLDECQGLGRRAEDGRLRREDGPTRNGHPLLQENLGEQLPNRRFRAEAG